MRDSKQPKMVERISAEANPDYGCAPEARPMADHLRLGVIAIDKPCGPSSHEVSAWVKRIAGAAKAGHSGTLDPQVSGVLPIALDDATKVLTFMLRSDKEYVGIMRFHKRLDGKTVRKLFSEHLGKIRQTPPVKSAVRRVERERRIYALSLLEFDGRDALFRVSCEAGTYIRKLCHDIGRKAGTGANMVELRRTRAAGFAESECRKLQELSDAMWLWRENGDERELRQVVIPVENALHIKRLMITDGAVEAVCAGAQLALPGIVKFEEGIAQGEPVAMLTLKGELVGVGEALMPAEMMKREKRGVAAKTLRIIMRPGTYPRMWKRHEPGAAAPPNTS